jgi:hypothetical protein
MTWQLDSKCRGLNVIQTMSFSRVSRAKEPGEFQC